MMATEKTVILSSEDINRKIDRIAYHIAEDYFESKKIVLVGIESKGYELAKKIFSRIKNFENPNVELVSLKIDKKNKQAKSNLEDLESIENNDVILIDDVLNTGKTLMYALGMLIQKTVKSIRIATLVDRKHRTFPVRAEYVGLTLSTTLQQHVEVVFNDNNSTAYLI